MSSTRRKLAGGHGRDLFASHNRTAKGAGKGDVPRHKFNKQWRDNYDEIDFQRYAYDPAFRREGARLIKSYGGAVQKITFQEYPSDMPAAYNNHGL